MRKLTFSKKKLLHYCIQITMKMKQSNACACFLLSLTPKQVMAALQITVFQCSHQLSVCIVSAHGRSKQRMLF